MAPRRRRKQPHYHRENERIDTVLLLVRVVSLRVPSVASACQVNHSRDYMREALLQWFRTILSFSNF